MSLCPTVQHARWLKRHRVTCRGCRVGLLCDRMFPSNGENDDIERPRRFYDDPPRMPVFRKNARASA